MNVRYVIREHQAYRTWFLIAFADGREVSLGEFASHADAVIAGFIVSAVTEAAGRGGDLHDETAKPEVKTPTQLDLF